MELTRDWAQGYFAHKLDSPELAISELFRFPRGSSRDTWFVTFQRSADLPQEKLVIRGDWATGAIDNSPLIDEYRIYRALRETAVPTAAALWWEDDPAWITDARPFYIREHVAGSWDIPGFLDPDPKYDDLRIAISKEHLRCLATVHAVDWRAAGFAEIHPVPRSCESAAIDYVTWILATIEEALGEHGEGFPILYEATEWLRDNAPVAPVIALCKGTNGLGEEVFRDGRIVAMSDWEESHLGDPAADFAFMQNFVPTVVRDGQVLWNLPIALEYYRSVGGAQVTVERVQYYGVVRFLRLAMTTTFAAASIEAEPSAAIRKAWVATEVMNLGKRGLAGAAGVLPMVAPERFAQLNQAM